MKEELMSSTAKIGGAELPPALRNKPNLRRWEAAQYLELVHGIKIAAATLAKKATEGGGPSYYSANRTPIYPKIELDKWAEKRLGKLVTSTSDNKNNEINGEQ